MSKHKVPWPSIIGGVVGCVTLLGILFGNVVAFGKASARSEEVAKTVEKLDAKVDEQAEELTEVKSDQRAVGKDIDAINEKLAEQKVMTQQIFEAVTRKR